jgi:nicotinamidase-related amidase
MAGGCVSRTIREAIPVEHRAAVTVLEDALGEMTVLDVVEWHTLSHPALEHPVRNQSWLDAA